MGLWDFVKGAGKSVIGEAHAEQKEAEPAADPKAEEKRKVDALVKEVAALGLTGNDVHLTLTGDTVKIANKDLDRATMEKLILAVGNIQGIAHVEAELPADPAGKDAVFHTVAKGETLSAIAKQYLGDAGKYREIFEANKPMLTDPDKIYPGQTLRIPQH